MTFQELQAKDWHKATVSFFVAKYVKGDEIFSLKLIEADEALQTHLRDMSTNILSRAKGSEPYDYFRAAQDDIVLELAESETDFPKLRKLLMESRHIPKVKNKDDLLDTRLSIIRLDLADEAPLFAVQYLSTRWATKKTRDLFNVAFSEHRLTIVQQPIFSINRQIDFFAHNGGLYIKHKTAFERALNFRAGLVKKRDMLLKDFENYHIIAAPQDAAALIGENMVLLRKAAQIHKSAYYKDKAYRDALYRLNQSEAWGLDYDKENRLILTKDNIKTTLTLLNNDRLTSKINAETFDVSDKHKATPSARDKV